MRTKEWDNRKQEFLDTALELFYEKGYENTTIRNIIDSVGVSKGAFYHYFGSKEEVLETIAMQYVEKKLTVIEKVAQEQNLNALGKFNKIIVKLQDIKIYYAEMRWKIFRIFAGNKNIKLKNQILDNFLEMAQPVYKNIIKQGIDEGIFHTDYPGEVAELYIHLNNIFKKIVSEMIINLDSNVDDTEILRAKIKQKDNIKMLTRKFSFYEDTLEKILGVKSGSIKLAETLLGQLRKEEFYNK